VYTYQLSPTQIGIAWDSANTYDFYQVRCCRDSSADHQETINSGGRNGSWAISASPDQHYVFKVQGCISHLAGSRCSSWQRLEVTTPDIAGRGGDGGQDHRDNSGGGALTATPSAPFLPTVPYSNPNGAGGPGCLGNNAPPGSCRPHHIQ
jgi:hypothetical protein